MRTWFKQLDDLLRGQSTSAAGLAEGRVNLSARRFFVLILLLGGVFGFFMGWFAVLRGGEHAGWQVVAGMIKLPALFLLTLLVTFPSLYVFNALIGCRLSFVSTLRLLVGAIAVNVTVAASLGPILGFFTLSTTSYAFMVLLNVALLSIAGVVALSFLLSSLRRVSRAGWIEIPPRTAEPADGAAQPQDGPLDPPDDADGLAQARSIFRIWVVIYALVGAQMGWLLRPFIGSPNMPFAWFRDRGGNFFAAVWASLQSLVAPMVE